MAESTFRPRRIGQYEFLLLALLTAVLVRPILQDGLFGRLILNVLTSAILIASAYAVSGQRKTLVVSLVLLVPGLISSWSTTLIDALWPMAASALLIFTFFAYVLSMMVRDILSQKDVTRDTIFGSACVYMLIGGAFAELFLLLQIVEPQSFGQAVDLAPVGQEVRLASELNYFSFVTLTTLGYGDIAPQTGVARGVATVEAMVGQFYLAVLVARLVGLHLAGSQLTRD
ncbi:MAG: two pore domain potassium channel family protein [Gemmatimonadota bacterium]|nr:MAG: two pore domain potassium channel family protein [Gemmatimonadota bacterium]